MEERNLNIFWYDLLEELITFWLKDLFVYYDSENDEFNHTELRNWVNELLDDSATGEILLHPLYYELIRSLDEPGYPPYDPRQNSPFESIMKCLHEQDSDRFYDLNRAMNQIFSEDAYEATSILQKDAYVAFLNKFANDFLTRNPDHTHIYLTNGSVGRRFEIPSQNRK